ncbi:MAG: hypothetical protein ABW101_07800 [Candidatus Thiodiazotropha sp.]
MLRHPFTLISAFLLGIPLLAQAEEPRLAMPLDLEQLTSVYRLKVVRITGLNPNGMRVELMADPQGVVLPVTDFSPLDRHLRSDESNRIQAYHTLQAELSPGLFVLDKAGQIVELGESISVPKKISLSGAVLSENGRMKALGVNPELKRMNQRCLDPGRRAHDD